MPLDRESFSKDSCSIIITTKKLTLITLYYQISNEYSNPPILLHIYIFTFSSIFGCTGFPLLFRLSPVVVSRGYFLVAVGGLLIAMASLAAEHGL